MVDTDGHGSRLWAVGTLSLRAHQSEGMLSAENVTVKICNPLPTGGGDVEVRDPTLDVRSDRAPIKIRVSLYEVGWRGISKLAIEAVFFELPEQRIRLFEVQGVAKLPDEIGCLDQPRLEVVRPILIGAV